MRALALAAVLLTVVAPAARASGDVQAGESSHDVLTQHSPNNGMTVVNRDEGPGLSGAASAGPNSASVSARLVDGPNGISVEGEVDMASSVAELDAGGAIAELSQTFTVTRTVSFGSSGTTTGEDVFTLSVVPTGTSPPVGAGTLSPGTYRFDLRGDLGCFSPGCTAHLDFELVVGQPPPPPPDTDGDALPDEWETDGIDRNQDGTVDLDLPALGADPLHKDVFVEVDFMAPHEFAQPAVDLVVNAFADAPVANPDGTTGIALHVDNGPASVMNPRTGELWGASSGHDEVPHSDVVGSVGPGGYDWSDFDALKGVHFAEEREPAFHYAISAHGHDGRASGIARAVPSSDFLVTLGAGCQALNGSDCTLAAQEQAGTLMHELGHNLGLRHGGGDDVTYKPSYLSVMNYAFQLTGLLRADLTTRLDYARFGVAMNEGALNESTGFGAPPGSAAAAFLTLGHCPNGSQEVWLLLRSPVDFDCNGAIATGAVATDTNNDGATSAFAAFSDWPNLVFKGGGVGDLGAPVLPQSTPRIEPPLAELQSAKQTLEDYVAAQRAAQPLPGGQPATSAPPAQPVRRAAPTLRALRVRSRGARVTVSYTLSEAGRVRFTVERVLPGRRRGRRCLPARRAPRGRRCTRQVQVRGSLGRAGRSGANSFRFVGRFAGRALRPGRYVLVATPLAPDGRPGAARRASFSMPR